MQGELLQTYTNNRGPSGQKHDLRHEDLQRLGSQRLVICISSQTRITGCSAALLHVCKCID